METRKPGSILRLSRCDEIVTIPGNGHVQPLNVAAAAAIMIYTLTRR
ncbi:MAG: hypothetical protein JO007_10075 [Alphaproteobacteria bacterium]|nr:hypothetical protein [Alphaproteobacteria bacterium]